MDTVWLSGRFAGRAVAEQLFFAGPALFAEVAQWQSNCFVNSRLSVQVRSSAHRQKARGREAFKKLLNS